jgi:hypothetical protein
MKIDKTIFSLDEVLSLSYGKVITQLEQMAEIKLDIFFRLLELNEYDEDFTDLTYQCHYLQINIDIFLNALDLLETSLIHIINLQGNKLQYSLN